MALVVRFGKDCITINTFIVPFENALSIVKSTTGRTWDKTNKVWNVPFSRENYEKLRDLLPPAKTRYYDEVFNQNFSGIKENFPFLRPYQVEAVDSILQGKRLIALPLGSGKTFVALSYLKQMNSKKSLIVAPSSLLYQWQSEAKRHFNLDLIILDEGRLKRIETLSKLKEVDSYTLIINYEKVILPDVKTFLLSEYFDLVILDEAHKIKNPFTKTHRALKKVNASTIILLTATPLVNSPLDIFNLVNFIYPGFFNYEEFCERYVEWKEIEVKTKNGTTKVIKVPTKAKNLQELHAKLKPVIFFKTKSEILKDLPPKTEQIYWVKPTKTQVELFEYYYSLPLKLVEKEGEGIFLACVGLMKQVANSTELLTVSDSPYAITPPSLDHPKVDLLKEEVLPFLEGKTIIFTEYKRMAQILYRELQEFKPTLLTGGVGIKQVDEILNKFEKSDSKILISTDVINFGKNLQFINTLIHYDLPWSPAITQQREGRIHRIGQENPVTIIKLITLNSIEKKIHETLYEKIEQFKTTLAGGKDVEIKNVVELVWGRRYSKNNSRNTGTLLPQV